MRDEIDGRIWSAHHDEFGRLVDSALDGLRAGLGRFGAWDGSTSHLLAIVAALAMTTLTFNATA